MNELITVQSAQPNFCSIKMQFDAITL